MKKITDLPFPAYAYLPGQMSHPAEGHVATAATDEAALQYGFDLFNHEFYWEAHEAWEPLWLAAPRSSPLRLALHVLILNTATRLKERLGEAGPAARLRRRAEECLAEFNRVSRQSSQS